MQSVLQCLVYCGLRSPGVGQLQYTWSAAGNQDTSSPRDRRNHRHIIATALEENMYTVLQSLNHNNKPLKHSYADGSTW